MNTDRMNAKFNPPPTGPCQRCRRTKAFNRNAAIGVPIEELCDPCAKVWQDELYARIEARA